MTLSGVLRLLHGQDAASADGPRDGVRGHRLPGGQPPRHLVRLCSGLLLCHLYLSLKR